MENSLSGTTKSLLLMLLLLARQAWSCQCPPLPKLNLNYCETYELIFKGVLTKLGNCKDVNKAHFKLNELYKGISPEEIDVYYDCSSDCAMSFSEGEEWIIYANYAQLGKPKTNFCSRSRKYIANENKLQTEYVNTDISFDQEKEFLTSNFGLHHFLKSNTNAELSHQNIKPGSLMSIVLILASIATFVLFYYLFNKYMK